MAMSDVSSMCLLCRSAAATARRRQAAHRLAAARPQRLVTPVTARARVFAALASTSTATAAANRHPAVSSPAPPSAPRESSSRPRQPLPAASSSPSSATTLALFESVVKGQSPPANPAQVRRPLTLDTYNALATLKAMLANRDTPIEGMYDFFRKKIIPGLVATRYVPEIFRREIMQLMSRVFVARAKDWTSTALPSLPELTLACLQLGLFKQPRALFWDLTVARLVLHLSRLSSPEAHDSVQSFEADAIAPKTRLLQDLLETWRLYHIYATLGCPMDRPIDLDSPFRFPSLADWSLRWRNAGDAERLERGLRDLFPNLPTASVVSITGPLLSTFVLFNDKAVSTPQIRAAALPLLTPLARIFAGTLSPDSVRRVPMHKDLSAYVSAQWPAVHQLLTGRARSTSALGSRRLSLGEREPKPLNLHEIIEHIDRGVENNSQDQLELAWSALVPDGDGPLSPMAIQFMADRLPVFLHLISAFTTLRLPERAAEVWNYTVSVLGIPESAKHYTAMMDGYKKARDLRGLEVVWSRALVSGVALDEQCWSVLIGGLIRCGKPREGLQMLKKMAQTWDANPHAVVSAEPTTSVVNIVLSSLLRLNDVAAAKGVLAWAERRGLNPDIMTYNVLLKSLVRDGSLGVGDVLAQMARNGVEPDNITITLLLGGLGPYLRGLSDQGRLDMVTKLLSIMPTDRRGKATRMYSKLVHVLLEHCEPGEDVTSVVNMTLSHMLKHHIEIPSSIYTILVEHYLSRSPPLVGDVLRLIDNHRLAGSGRWQVEGVFWQRVILGLIRAQPRNPRIAFKVVADLLHPSTAVPLSALHKLLDALWGAGDAKSAARLVKMVKDDWNSSSSHVEANGEDQTAHASAATDGLSAPQSRDAHFWSHKLWEAAASYGLHQR